MVIFHSYVSLPEGNGGYDGILTEYDVPSGTQAWLAGKSPKKIGGVCRWENYRTNLGKLSIAMSVYRKVSIFNGILIYINGIYKIDTV